MKSILKFFNFKFLILGIIFGFFALSYSDSEKRVIRVWPTPENIDVIQYQDSADNCFTFENILVDCPSDPDQINSIPVQ
jgi:hypothetical protein